MSTLESPTPTYQYPQVIQLKLYQAFIFSIPIFLSIILFMLFYLFYLKRLSSRISSNRPVLPMTANDDSNTMSCNADSKGLKNKLCTILFDESTEAMDLMCCVCLGEFQLKEELVQVSSCKHMFHEECIRHWLCNHSTCPLCRDFIVLVSITPPSPRISIGL